MLEYDESICRHILNAATFEKKKHFQNSVCFFNSKGYELKMQLQKYVWGKPYFITQLFFEKAIDRNLVG